MKFLFGDMIVKAVQTFKPIAAQVDMKLGGYYIWSSSSDEPHGFCMLKTRCSDGSVVAYQFKPSSRLLHKST